MNTKFTTDGHTVYLKKKAILTMVANQRDPKGADELVILFGEDRKETISKLLKDLPNYCKSNGITSDYFPASKTAIYFKNLDKLY